MAEQLQGINYLRERLTNKASRVNKRYNYYEMHNDTLDLNVSTPPQLLWFEGRLGWCAKAVDALADRLKFKEFRNDRMKLTEIFKLNNYDILFDSAIKSALISSCSFIYISKDEKGFPRLQVIDGYNATGILDPVTNMLTEGYAVLDRDVNGLPILEAYFTSGKTEYFYTEHPELNFTEKHASKFPALVPIIHRPDARRPFGHSRITRACMSLQDSAIRTIKRSEISAEFYSVPQKYVTGLSQNAEPLDKWKASMSSMLTFTKDEDGDKPVLGQFTQQSMAPHIEQLRMFASAFAGETGLTLEDLGFSTDNPASADAIKNGHEGLRLAARKAQDNFSVGFINAGIVAASIRDEFDYERKAFYETKVIWYPVFEPDGQGLSTIGDGAIKINQSVPNFFDAQSLSDLTGLDRAE